MDKTLKIFVLVAVFGSFSVAKKTWANESLASGDEIRMPHRLECKNGDGEIFRINTRAELINQWHLIPDGVDQTDLVLLDSSLEPMIESDEVFSKGEYFSLTLNQKYLRAAAWTCDSADYALSFKTDELALKNVDSSIDDLTKTVAGKLIREMRGSQELKTEDISCQAQY